MVEGATTSNPPIHHGYTLRHPEGFKGGGEGESAPLRQPRRGQFHRLDAGQDSSEFSATGKIFGLKKLYIYISFYIYIFICVYI